jgi:hypothetical protein
VPRIDAAADTIEAAKERQDRRMIVVGGGKT